MRHTLWGVTGAEATLLAGIVGGVSAAAAAGFAAFGTYRATNRTVTAQRQQEDRNRIAQAYIDLLGLVQTKMTQVDVTRPQLVIVAPAEVADVSFADEARIRAQIEAVGSSSVRSKLFEWRAALLSFRIAVGDLDEIAGYPSGQRPSEFPASEWRTLSDKMQAQRTLVHDLTKELENLVRTELALRGSHRSSVQPVHP
jgi:hypothetical protein